MPKENEKIDYSKDYARKHIQQLKEGTIIVRLRSYRKKLSRLEELIESGELGSIQQDRLKTVYDNTIADKEKSNRAMIYAFKNFYNFSDYRFLYDSSFNQIDSIDYSSIVFLNEHIEEDPSIKLEKYPVYIFGHGRAEPSTSTGIESWVLYDNFGDPIKHPVPRYATIRGPFRRYIKLEYVPGKNNWKVVKVKSKKKLNRTERSVIRWQSKMIHLFVDTQNYYKRKNG